MKIIFMGTSEFGIPSLKTLMENKFDILSVVTVPDKKQGRGQKIIFSPIKKFAVENSLPILQVENLKDENFIHQINSLNPDLIIVVAFKILPKEIFSIPKFGSINLHASLLPKYRGAAPINWAIINGENETGVTTFFLKEKVDTGNIILQNKIPIENEDNFGTLYQKLSVVGANTLLKTIDLIAQNKIQLFIQNENLVSSAPKIFKNNCKINWNKSAFEIHNFIRGLSPMPSANSFHKKNMLKILQSKIVETKTSFSFGTVVENKNKLIVAANDFAVEILEIQKEGKSKMEIKNFLRGYKIEIGEKFE